VRLLIDATTAQHARGGIGVVVSGFLRAIQERNDVEAMVLAGPVLDVGELRTWRPPLITRTPARLVFQRLALPAVTALGHRWLGRPERVLYLDSYVPQWRWPGGNVRQETFVHDVLPLTHPQYFARQKDVAKRMAMEAIRRQKPRVYTSCEFTAGEIRRELGLEAVVAPFGCGQLTDQETDVMLNDTSAERGDYLLYVGATEERKDLRTLVEGFLLASSEDTALRLAFVGDLRTAEAQAFRAWAKERAGDRVRFLGRKSSEDTFRLLRHARAVVYPSVAEGFGLPVLEGMAMGTPVITTDIPVIRSWALDGPRYFSAGDGQSLAAAIRETTNDSASTRLRRGKEIAEPFRWSRFTERILAA
jgi:glycosyltransferase involved in cell wall biosynthesis